MEKLPKIHPEIEDKINYQSLINYNDSLQAPSYYGYKTQ